MEEAAQGHESAMVAVLGLDREPLQAACETAADLGTVVIANYNCPGQLVLGGDKAAVEKAAALAKEKGARRFGEPQIPVLFNCLGDVPAEPKADIPGLLVRQVMSSVYMEQSIRNMSAHAEALVEIGPGKALSGFVKKTVDTPICAVETVAEVEGLAEALCKAVKGE